MSADAIAKDILQVRCWIGTPDDFATENTTPHLETIAALDRVDAHIEGLRRNVVHLEQEVARLSERKKKAESPPSDADVEKALGRVICAFSSEEGVINPDIIKALEVLHQVIMERDRMRSDLTGVARSYSEEEKRWLT